MHFNSPSFVFPSCVARVHLNSRTWLCREVPSVTDDQKSRLDWWGIAFVHPGFSAAENRHQVDEHSAIPVLVEPPAARRDVFFDGVCDAEPVSRNCKTQCL